MGQLIHDTSSQRFLRIYDPPLSHLKPCFQLFRQVGGRGAGARAPWPRCTRAARVSFLRVSFWWWHSRPSSGTPGLQVAPPAFATFPPQWQMPQERWFPGSRLHIPGGKDLSGWGPGVQAPAYCSSLTAGF